MPNPTAVEFTAAFLLLVAIIHTFSTGFFARLARQQPRHAGLWHGFAEVEVVFGFWAMVLTFAMFVLQGAQATTRYIDSRDFTEPLFVFAIMVIAGTRPVLHTAFTAVRVLARQLPLPGSLGAFGLILGGVPLMGSFITEPAAMTLGALMLSEQFFARGISVRLKYASLAVLLVNVSIGGTLTPFAAPPVLMVAATWGWDLGFMFSTFGIKALLAVLVNTVAVGVLFRKELASLSPAQDAAQISPVPGLLSLVHYLFLAGVVYFSHHPGLFMGLFVAFVGVVHAYERHQDRLIWREALLVAFFLAGLVVLGGQQQWWLQPVLMGMDSHVVFWGALVLTAFTDNAALTYLGSLVEGLSDAFKYALVAGAVAGGGLTIIANAPNPAGIAILRGHFKGEVVHPFWLLVAALPPTGVAVLAFLCL